MLAESSADKEDSIKKKLSWVWHKAAFVKEAHVLDIWKMQSPSSFLLLVGSIWPRELVPVCRLLLDFVELLWHFNPCRISNTIPYTHTHTHTHTHIHIYIYIYIYIYVCIWWGSKIWNDFENFFLKIWSVQFFFKCDKSKYSWLVLLFKHFFVKLQPSMSE